MADDTFGPTSGPELNDDELPSEIDPAEVAGLTEGVDQIIAVGFPTAEDERKRLIDPVRIEVIFMDCLYRSDEIIGEAVPADRVRVRGVISEFGFHPQRLASHREEVHAVLELLPIEFQSRQTGGSGGWSFLQACVDKNGTLWTGLHRRVEQLVALGIGLGYITWQFPPDMWSVLPGGMPYLEINL